MVNEIVARLTKGENIDDIARELTDALNAASDQYEKVKEAAAKSDKKKKDMQAILDLVHDFFIEYYCDTDKDYDVVHEAFADFDAEAAIGMIEHIGAMTKQMSELETMFGAIKPLPRGVKIGCAPAGSNTDEVINQFLKSIGVK